MPSAKDASFHSKYANNLRGYVSNEYGVVRDGFKEEIFTARNHLQGFFGRVAECEHNAHRNSTSQMNSSLFPFFIISCVNVYSVFLC